MIFAVLPFYFNNTELCEPRDQTFQDWLMNLGDLQRTNLACLYLVLTHEPGYTIDDIDIQTYLDNNDVLYTPLYDNIRGNTDLKQELGISRSYLLEAAPKNNLNLLQELRALSEVEDCTYNENLQPDRHIEFFPDAPALPQYFYPEFFDRIGETDYWKASRNPNHKVLTAVIDNFRSLVPDAGIPPSHGEFVAEIADSGETDMLLLNVMIKYKDEESAPFDAVFKAIEYAVDEKIEGGYDTAVINLSLSAPVLSFGEDADEQQRIAELFQRWLQYAARSGVSVVTSMGNLDWNVPHFPAALPETIAVGGTNQSYQRWKGQNDLDYFGSNFGWHLDLMTLADFPDTDKPGTSFAAAHVSRTAASILEIIVSQNPNLVFETFDQRLRWLLNATAFDQIGDPGEDTPGWDPYYGWGFLDAETALECAKGEQILIRPSSVDFPTLQMGDTATASVRIINCFYDTAFTLTHDIQGSDDFNAADRSTDQFLAPGQTRTVDITFNPQSIGGNKNARLDIVPAFFTDDPATVPPEPLAISLTGTASCPGRETVSVTPAVHDFGAVSEDDSRTMQFTLMNCHNEKIRIKGWQFIGSASDAQFIVSGLQKNQDIRKYSWRTFEISFEPQTPLAQHAIIQIETEPFGPIEIGLYGRMTALPAPEPPWPADPRQALAQADILMAQAEAMYKADAFWEALELFDQARAIYHSAQSQIGRAKALNGMGLSYSGAGRLRQAVDALSQAKAIYQDLSDRLREGVVLNQIALLHTRSGNSIAAVDTFNELLAIERDLQLERDAGRTLMNLGAVYFNQNDFDQARIYFEEALAVAQSGSDLQGQAKALLNIGNICRHDENHAQALEAYEKALTYIRQIEDSAVEEGALLLESGDIRMLQNDYAGALNLFRESLDIFEQAAYATGRIAALQKIAELYQFQEKTAEALNTLRRALALYPAAGQDKEAEVLRQMLEICEDQDDTALHAAILNDLAEIHTDIDALEKALELLNRAEDIQPSDGDKSELRRTYMLFGEVFLRQKNGNALDYLQYALNIRENGAEYGDEARIQTDIGQAYLQQDNYDAARAQLIELKNGRALLYMGELYLQTAEDDSALEKFNQALQALDETDHENLAGAYNGLASVYARLGQSQRAIEAFKKALLNYRLAGDSEKEALTLTSIGNFYADQGNNSQAVNAYQEALECYRQLDDSQEQLAILQRIIDLNDPHDAAMQLELGKAYTDAGEYDDALTALANAMNFQNDPAVKAEILLQTGIVLRIQGEYDAALDNMREALRIETDSAILHGGILSNIGETYFRQGLYDKALLQYELALEQHRTAGDLEGEGLTLMKIGEAYLAKDEHITAIQYYDDALEILKLTDEHIYQIMAYLDGVEAHGRKGLYWDAVEAYLRYLAFVHEAGMFMYAEDIHRYKIELIDTPTTTTVPTTTSTLPSVATTISTTTSTLPSTATTISTTTSTLPSTATTIPTTTSTPPSVAATVLTTTSTLPSTATSVSTTPPTTVPTIMNTSPSPSTQSPASTTSDTPLPTAASDPAAPKSNTTSFVFGVEPDNNVSESKGDTDDESQNQGDDEPYSEPPPQSDTSRSNPPANSQSATSTPAAKPSTLPETLFTSRPSIPAPPLPRTPLTARNTLALNPECRLALEDKFETDDPLLLKTRADTLKKCAENYLRDADYAASLEMTLPEIDIRKRLQDREGAILALIRKLTLFQQTGRVKTELADVMREITDLLILEGRDQEALKYLHDMLAIFREVGDHAREAQTLNSIGIIHLRQGDFFQAERAFLDAQEILKNHHNAEIQALTAANLGALRYLSGQYDEAEIFFQKALGVIDRLESGRLLDALLLLAKAAYAHLSGQDTQARRYFEQALVILKDTTLMLHRAAVLNHLALTQYKRIREARAKYEEIEPRYKQAKDIFLKAGAALRALGEDASAYAVANNMGLLDYTMGRIAERHGKTQEAAVFYKQALAMYQEVYAQEIASKAGQGATLHNIGQVYAALGQYDEALAHFQQALKNELSADKAQTLSEIGYVYEHKNDFNQAIAYYGKSIKILEDVRWKSKVDQFKISLAEQSADVYQRAILLRIAMGQMREAFNLSEQARARALLEQLGNQPARLPGKTPSGLTAEKLAMENKLRQLRQKLQKARAWNAKNKKTGIKSDSAIKLLERKIDAKMREYDQLSNALEIYQAESRTLTRVEPLTLEQVRQRLDPHTSLVSYFVTPAKTAAFILTRDSFHAVEIPIEESELARTIHWLPQSGGAAYPTLPALQKLHKWLAAPVIPYLKTPRVSVIPHGILHHVPFHALTADGKSYFGEKHTLSRLPSASVLRFARKKHPKSEAGKVLAIGNPSGPAYGLETLKHVKHETASVAEIFATKGYIAQEATESRFISEAEKARIIFVSSHARLNSVRPLYSHLVLMPDVSHDGLLEVREINKLDLRSVELVVLSACNTYLGKQSRGDDVVGLTRAFFHAGASSVVSSLWKVYDEPTGFFMKSFSRSLSSGMGKAEALARARIATRQKYSNPLFWAAFVLTGE